VQPLESILRSLLAWAQEDQNVVALIQTGSTARTDGRHDEFSDLDVEVIARAPGELLTVDSWFTQLADVWITKRFDDVPFPTRLVVYDGGVKVDYTIAGPDRIDDMKGELDPLYQRGYRVLLDKDGLTTDLPAPTAAFGVPVPPTQTQFTAVVEEFWFEAAHMPRYLLREDLWVVKFRDWTMKEDLLEMLEWHAAGRSGDFVDTWYIGTRMKEWVDSGTWQHLHEIFGHFDQEDTWRALFATVELFARVSRETAASHALSYSVELEVKVRNYLQSSAPHSQPH
jgi:aminoglycoside 6-adenylyltransferase